jgi:hypothetical protein
LIVKFGLIVFAVVGFSAGVCAQTKAVWSDIDCSQSKIVAPPGLKCRATQELAGSTTAKFAGPGGGQGVFREWATFGKKDGVKLYYLGHETIGPNSYKAVFLTLEQEIRDHSPYAKDGRNFTATSPMAGSDYVRFTSGQGEACVAVRKVGPVRSKGYAWVLLANKCVPAGNSVSDIAQLISTADFRP